MTAVVLVKVQLGLVLHIMRDGQELARLTPPGLCA